MDYHVETESTTIQEPIPVYDEPVDIEVPSDENMKLTEHELIERYATIQGISYEEAELQVGAPTAEEILKKIEDKTVEKINSTRVPMNRAQRRALKKKVGAKKYAEMVADTGDAVEAVSETARKLNYINLIQKLRELNAKKENEKDGETTIEDD